MRRDERLLPSGLDPEAAALLSDLPTQGAMTCEELVEARAVPLDPELTGRPEATRVKADLTLPLGETLRPVRLYRGNHVGPRPVILWLHGGGFVGGSLDDIDATCAAIARRSGVILVSLSYRLAPESPYPDALDDTTAAVPWLGENAGALGGDGRIAVEG